MALSSHVAKSRRCGGLHERGVLCLGALQPRNHRAVRAGVAAPHRAQLDLRYARAAVHRHLFLAYRKSRAHSSLAQVPTRTSRAEVLLGSHRRCSIAAVDATHAEPKARRGAATLLYLERMAKHFFLTSLWPRADNRSSRSTADCASSASKAVSATFCSPASAVQSVARVQFRCRRSRTSN